MHHILSSPSSSGLDSLAQQSCHSCGCHDDRDAVEVEEVDDLLSVWLCPADCTPLHWVSWLIGTRVHNAAENADIIGHAAKLTPGYTLSLFHILQDIRNLLLSLVSNLVRKKGSDFRKCKIS